MNSSGYFLSFPVVEVNDFLSISTCSLFELAVSLWIPLFLLLPIKFSLFRPLLQLLLHSSTEVSVALSVWFTRKYL